VTHNMQVDNTPAYLYLLACPACVSRKCACAFVANLVCNASGCFMGGMIKMIDNDPALGSESINTT
jgi:hypothetical protein